MILRRWHGYAFGLACVAAVAFGILARPEDGFGRMRELYHPMVEVKGDDTTYVFPPSVTEADLRKALNAEGGADLCDVGGCYGNLTLPDGRETGLHTFGAGSCTLIVHADRRPWHLRTWLAFKHRLGM
jgi:hypothetical protein